MARRKRSLQDGPGLFEEQERDLTRRIRRQRARIHPAFFARSGLEHPIEGPRAGSRLRDCAPLGRPGNARPAYWVQGNVDRHAVPRSTLRRRARLSTQDDKPGSLATRAQIHRSGRRHGGRRFGRVSDFRRAGRRDRAEGLIDRSRPGSYQWPNAGSAMLGLSQRAPRMRMGDRLELRHDPSLSSFQGFARL